MLLKKINRYAAIRMPNELNYTLSIKRNRSISKYNNIGKNIVHYKDAYSRISITIEVHNGGLSYYCSNCGKFLNISNDVLCSIRYFKCICGCLNDMKSKNAMRYYLIYKTDLYNQIISKRRTNQSRSYKRKMDKENFNKAKILKSKEPLIIKADSNSIFYNNRIIVPSIWKEIVYDDTLTQHEKEILCRLEMPVARYKKLIVLGVTFDNNSKHLSNEEIREIRETTNINVDKAESVGYYH